MALIKWFAFVLPKYCTPKLSIKRVNVVHFFVCHHRPAGRDTGSHMKGESFGMRLSKEITPSSLRPYINFNISR